MINEEKMNAALSELRALVHATGWPDDQSLSEAVKAMARVIAAADKCLGWRSTEGFKIVDPNLREYVEACKALEAGARRIDPSPPSSLDLDDSDEQGVP